MEASFAVRRWLFDNDFEVPAIHEPFMHVLRGHEAPVSSVAFAPDGNRLASASRDGTIRVWDLRQPQASPVVLAGTGDAIKSVAFVPDGNRLAAVSSIYIWISDLRQPHAAPRYVSKVAISVATARVFPRRGFPYKDLPGISDTQALGIAEA